METELQRAFYEIIRANFGFLLADGRFRGPLSTLDSKTGVFTVMYTGTNLAVELTLDERDEDIGCFIARTIDGRPSLEYDVDDYGKLVRASVTRVLRAMGVRDRLFTRVTGLPLNDRILITLRDYERILLTYGQMVLADDPAFLDDCS